MAQDVSGIYERMMRAWQVKGYRELGAKLGRPPGTIASRKYQRTVPPLWIVETALATGCRKEWLLTGEEPMSRGDLRVSDLTAPLQEVVRLMLEASESAQAALLRVARTLAPVDQVTDMHPVMNGVIAAEYHARIAEQLRTDVPDTPAD
jgi:hypothetical protein